MKTLLKAFLFRLRSFLYPDFCFDCGAEVDPHEEFCTLCLRLTLEETVPAVIESESDPISRYYSCFSFEESLVRRVVHAIKYQAFPAPALSLLEKRVPQLELGRYDYIVPIPLHWKRKNWRGYNQAELMAFRLAERENIPVINLLKRCRNTVTQTRKKRWQRKGAMKAVFALNSRIDLKNKTIILVDDVATTGATAGECAKILIQSGAESVSLLTLARA